MRESMEIIYPRTAAERAMKLQEVLLRATSGKIQWWQAAELIGISERQMRRWRKRLEEQGPQGLLDRRRRKPSSRRVAKKQAEEVLGLYRDKYFDLNVRHFHEKLSEDHQIGLSYTWVKQALQAAGLVKRKAKRGVQRPLPGMMLHIDGSDMAHPLGDGPYFPCEFETAASNRANLPIIHFNNLHDGRAALYRESWRGSEWLQGLMRARPPLRKS
jgi:transposase